MFYDRASQYISTVKSNVTHFLFNLLRIKGLYTFRTLLDYPQESLHSGTWYIVCVLCQLAAPGLQLTDITCTQYTKCQLCTAS
jgi:hypothetical protein